MTVRVSKPAFNIREALNSLRRKIGIKGGELMAAETVDDFYKAVGTGKNWIINGDMRISQRGTYTTATSFPSSTYLIDRWKSDTNIACTLQHVTSGQSASGFSNRSSKVAATATASNSYMGAIQLIEDYALLANKTITLSAWVRSNSNNANISIYSGNSAYTIVSKPHSGNGGWEKLSVTGVFDPSPAYGRLGLYLTQQNSGLSTITINTGDYIEFTDVQLEVGSVATPFERRPYGTELALCQRYYESGTWNMIFPAAHPAAQLVRTYGVFLVQKRATPSVSFNDGNGNSGKIYYNGANKTAIAYGGGPTYFQFQSSDTPSNGYADVTINYFASAEL